MTTLLRTTIVSQNALHRATNVVTSRLRTKAGESGEGVISLAIAVLIMAVIGAAMFIVFKQITDDAGNTATTKISTIK